MLYIVIYLIVSYLYFKSFGGKTQFNAKVLTGVVMLLAFIVGMGDMNGEVLTELLQNQSLRIAYEDYLREHVVDNSSEVEKLIYIFVS